MTAEMLLLGGNMFNHVTHPRTNSIIIWTRTMQNGRLLQIDRQHSFIVQMQRSTSVWHVIIIGHHFKVDLLIT